MIIDGPAEFWDWVDRIEKEADAGDERAAAKLDIVTAQLAYLNELRYAPDRSEETATLKYVRQSGRHTVWRVSHPYREGVAMRLICWFPPDTDTVVVTLFCGDKARIGDVFYNSVGSRADPLIDQWKREAKRSRP